MRLSDNPLKLNYNSDESKRALQETFSNLPDEIEVYLIGGSVRNALIREIHGEVLRQRDYDQVITRGSRSYKTYLGSLGFEEHPYPSRQDEQVVYRKLFDEQHRDDLDYLHWIVYDMHTVDGTTIEQNIKNNVAFTINGCAINGRDLFTKPWREALIQVLPTALQDIKDKKLRLNRDGYKYMPSSFFAMLRFMSAGFEAPSDEEVQLLLAELPNLEHARYERNVIKVWDYVGGEAKARELVKGLGIDLDVFDEEAVKSRKM